MDRSECALWNHRNESIRNTYRQLVWSAVLFKAGEAGRPVRRVVLLDAEENVVYLRALNS